MNSRSLLASYLFGRNGLPYWDFNSYTQVGTYSTVSNGLFEQMTNRPGTSTSGILFVLKPLATNGAELTSSNYILQLYLTYNGVQLFKRSSTDKGSTWGNWVILAQAAT